MLIIKYYNFINESLFEKRFKIERSMLFEDKESRYIKNMIKNNCDDYYKQYLDTLVADLPNNIKSSISQHNPTLYEKCINNNANLMMYLRLDFLQNFDIRRDKGPVKYIIGLSRIGIGELGYFTRSANQSDLALLKQLVLFAYNNEEVNKELDSNLNNMTFDELKEMLNDRRRKYNEANKSKLSSKKVSSKDYKIVPILSADQAKKYGKYTSWCITHGSYDSYAKNGSRFYFCLKNGFENVKKKAGDGCPLDDYGLSMVSVLVDMDGEPTIITTRWNHEYDGENNENLHTAEQVQEILGIPFYQTFKPYNKEELKKLGIVSFDEAKERLESGEDPSDIFQDVSDAHDGFARIKLNDKWNFIDKHGKLLNDKWLDGVGAFNDGVATIILNDKYNFIDQNGKFLSDKWFDYAGHFANGVARIKLNGKWNFIDKQGKLLSDKWFDMVDYFYYGFARIKLNDKWNFIDKHGKLLSDKWLDYAYDFNDGFAIVELNDKWNLIGANGKLLSDEWFNGAYDFDGSVARVNVNDKWNFIVTNGKFLSDKWFDYACNFDDGFAMVKLNDKWNFIDKQGKLLSYKWFDYAYNFNDGFAMINLNGKWNFIDKQGKPLSDKWFDYAYDFNDGVAMVKLNGIKMHIDKNGNLLT